jgi:acetyl esterase/lipase
VLLFLHGGGFVLRATDAHWELAARLSAGLGGAPTALPLYPLAPAFSCGAALRFVERVHSVCVAVAARAPGGAAPVALVGDSAGGGLALALAQSLVAGAKGGWKPGRRVPGLDALVLLCPLVDAAVSQPAAEAVDDPMLSLVGLRAAGEMWAGPGGVAAPRCSPLYGRMAGLPPTTLWVASRDVLGPQGIELRDALAAATPPVRTRFVLGQGQLHDWPVVEISANLPEADASVAGLVRALKVDLGYVEDDASPQGKNKKV